MRFVSLGVAALCLAASLAVAGETLSADGAGKVYTDGQNVTVSIVPLKPRKPERVLIKVAGTRSTLDDLVLLHEVEDLGNSRANFKRKYRGADYVTITAREAWNSAKNFEVYPPGTRDSVKIHYDKKLSEALKPDAIVAEYYNRRLEPLTGARAELESKETKAFEARTSAVNQECGATVKARIDWTSIPEDALKGWNVAAGCNAALTAVENLCDDEVGKEAVKGKIKEVVCRFGSKPEFSAAGGKFTATLAKDVTDVQETAYAYLMEKL